MKFENERVKVIVVSAEEQKRRVHEAVARRAYQIFETHKQTPSCEIQDWLRAESEVIHPFFGGRMPINGNVWLGIDPNVFERGTIEMWVAPHRLAVCGTSRAGESSGPNKEKIYEVIELSEEVDPARVTATVKSGTLEIVVGKVEHGKEAEKESKVAA